MTVFIKIKARFLIDKFFLRNPTKNGLGFTLIETVVAIAIFTLTISIVSGLILMAYRTHSYNWQQSAAIEEARKGVDVMIKELREARSGEDGSYPIEVAGDKEIIFFSDINNDNKTERVRYFWGAVTSGISVKECVSYSRGGSCSVNFSNFFTGILKSAQVKIDIEGDLGSGYSSEYAEIFVDGNKLGDLCRSGCTDCAGAWQGTAIFDIVNQASDNSIQFIADGSSRVDPSCNWQNSNHSLKARFELRWTEETPGVGNELKKGVIYPTVSPIEYSPDQEKISALSFYIRNDPPIFEYFDQDGNQIIEYPARLVDTKVIKVFLVIDVNPYRSPSAYELESSVLLRNLKTEE
jgi:type II secretory pathway pseudopilin PulG